METQFIKLNMTPTGVNPCFHVSQYDIGRSLGFMIYNGSEVVDLDSYTCTIEATRSDGVAITSSVATDDNVGTFETTATMTNKADKYKAQFVIVDENSKRIASLPFDMDVIKAAMDENAESIEEDASLYQQYTEAVQGAIAEANANIQTEENARIAAVNAEATTRANVDATLQNNIDAEATTRANVDATLQNNIDAEATARANAITAEATARQTADNTLQGNINSEASTRASADSNLQSQINQIVAPSGEAPSAAEVQNARIGADGVTYDTLGNAIRGQVSDLKSDLNIGNGDPYYYIYTTKKPNNLINKYRLIAGEYINASGSVSNASGWNRTDYIDISDYTHITMTGGIGNSAFYNASKQFISTVSSQQIGYAVPSGAVYMRCSVVDANLSTALLNGGSVQLPYDDGCVVIPLHKKEYQAGWIPFTVPVNQTIVKYNSTTSSRDDSQDYINVECVLKLPNTYTANGVPTKLVMLCHGAGRGVTFPNPSDNKAWIDLDEYNTMVNYFVTNGYAVFDCNGYDNTWLGVNFWGAPKGIEAWRKAYDYIVDNYNVEREFTLFGFSMGGLTACSLMMNGFPNIKCAILASPVLDLEKCWEDGQTAFMQAGYGMTTSYDPNIIGGSDPTKHLVTINNIEYCMPKMPPIKIWYGSTEQGIAVNKSYAQRLVNAIQASGGFAVYREVAGAGHEICYGGNSNCNLEYYYWANRFNDNYYN